MLKRFVAVLAVGLTMICANEVQAGRPANRFERQGQRIGGGVGNGELTRRETFRLMGQQAHIRHEVHRARSDGDFTGLERAHVERMQDRASRNIFRQKHDGQDR